MADAWLSNTYLVADEDGGTALLRRRRRARRAAARGDRRARPDAHPRAAHPPPPRPRRRARRRARALPRRRGARAPRRAGGRRASTGTIEPGDKITIGGLERRGDPHARPHRRDAQLARRRHTSSPATRCSRARSAACARPARRPTRTSAPRSWTRCSQLPPETAIHPGHTDPTTVGDEWENNSFIRVWRGLDPEGDEPCTASAQPATLVLLGDDYDGGHKAWVRWPDGARRHRARLAGQDLAQESRQTLSCGAVKKRSDPFQVVVRTSGVSDAGVVCPLSASVRSISASRLRRRCAHPPRRRPPCPRGRAGPHRRLGHRGRAPSRRRRRSGRRSRRARSGGRRRSRRRRAARRARDRAVDLAATVVGDEHALHTALAAWRASSGCSTPLSTIGGRSARAGREVVPGDRRVGEHLRKCMTAACGSSSGGASRLARKTGSAK